MFNFIKDFFNKRSNLIGKRVYIFTGDYKGMTGKIEYCDKCCHNFRIQFDGIGNNEPYDYLKDSLTFFI